MEELLKYKWAFIGTIGFHILLAFGFKQYKFEAKFEPLELIEMPVMLESEPIKKIENPLDQSQLTENEKIANKTFNEADKMGNTNQAYDSRKYSNVNKSVDEELENLEKEMFEEMKSNREQKYGVNNATEVPKKNEPKKDKTVKEESTNTSNNSNNRTMSTSRVAASYDLNGRRDEYFAKPSYICKGRGNIVLKVKVNRSGRVISADVDASASTYTEECMAENAKKYALKCKFEAGTKFPDPQSGTITYTYVAQ